MNQDEEARKLCESYAVANGYRTWIICSNILSSRARAALVIIDTIPENLENILAKKFQFGVEVVEILRYRNKQGDVVYHFEPFLSDLDQIEDESKTTTHPPVALPSTTDVDTIVVPAQEDGFKRVFLGENRWHEVRIHGSMRPQIKHIAVYQVAPISAITHLAPVKSISSWKDFGKFVLHFSEPAHESDPSL